MSGVPCVRTVSSVLEIALRLTPPTHRAKRTADALRRELGACEHLRLVSIDLDSGRAALIVAVALGEPDDVREGTGPAQDGLRALRFLLDRFRDCDPAFVPLDAA